jgi:predicted nuclease of predicted toxin-antitoxin system
MKLLVDNQLPVALAGHLRGWGLDCVHVLEVGLNKAHDPDIWQWATTEGRIVVTKDEDFLLLATRPGDQGRMIWVRLGNCRNPALLAAFDRTRDALLRAIASGQRVIELR